VQIIGKAMHEDDGGFLTGILADVNAVLIQLDEGFLWVIICLCLLLFIACGALRPRSNEKPEYQAMQDK
jgi:hypothetical protein